MDYHEVTDELIGGAGDLTIKWFRNIELYLGLLEWFITYMMAKGITITPEVLSRPQRRALARSKNPQPWHVVTVEPRFKSGESGGGVGTGSQYRYDVMGHLRFNRHRLKDGSWRDTIEVVRPHQRGLEHERYIPKVSQFKGERVWHPAMERYFKGEVLVDG